MTRPFSVAPSLIQAKCFAERGHPGMSSCELRDKFKSKLVEKEFEHPPLHFIVLLNARGSRKTTMCH